MHQMTTTQPYSKAPITEAIIDLRVKLPESVTLSELEHLQASEHDAYPTRKKIRLAHGLIEVGEAVATSARSIELGFMFTSPDEKQVFQGKLDGFAFSR